MKSGLEKQIKVLEDGTLRHKFEMFMAADINMTSQNYHDNHNVIRQRTQLGDTHLSWRLDIFSI